MARTVTQIRVFVGSPGDTKRERSIVDEVVRQINDGALAEDKCVTLRLVRWERDAWPGFGQDAQDVINQQIGPYDIFVGIMRNRLGTPTHRAASGSVEEFERAYQSWFKHKIPTIMLYFSKEPVHVADLEQLEEVRKVLEFKKRVESLGGLSGQDETVDDFKRLIRDHLEQEILKRWSASGDLSVVPPAVVSSGPRQERFLVQSDWPKLVVIGDWTYQLSHPRVHGSGVYQYILSQGEYGHRPFRVKAKLRFFDYDLHRGGIDNGNAGIIFGWKGTEGASTYLNLSFYRDQGGARGSR